MKKMSILIGIFTVFLLNCFVLSAYSKKQNVYNLNGTSWELAQVSRKGKNVVIPKEAKITINFLENEINGFSGINNYSGDYTVNNNFTLSADVATTLMAGPENLMNIEQNFLDILQSFPKISYNGYNASTLTLSNKKEVWTFKVLTLNKKLKNTSWKLLNMDGKDISKLISKNDNNITLSFNENGINGNSGINNYFGKYEIVNNNIKVSPLGSTEMAGPENLMKIEREFLKLLENSKKIKLSNQKTLVLTTDKGKTLIFEKIYQ
jgi:hypothetical protein